MSETPCRHFEDDLSTWIFEGSLHEKRLAPLKGHLRTCESCRLLKGDYERMKPLLHEEPLRAPPALKNAVLLRIAAGNSSRRSWMGPFSYAAAASVLAVMFWGLNHENFAPHNSLALRQDAAKKAPESVAGDRWGATLVDKSKTRDGIDTQGASESLGRARAQESRNSIHPSAPSLRSETKIKEGSDKKKQLEGHSEAPGGKMEKEHVERVKMSLSFQSGEKNNAIEEGAKPATASKDLNEKLIGKVEFKQGLRLRVLKKDLKALDGHLSILKLARKAITLSAGETPAFPYWGPDNEGIMDVPLQSHTTEEWEFLEIIQVTKP